MASFSLVTLQPKGFPHVSAFLDIKLLLYYSLKDLGHDVVVTTNRFPEGATAIVFGAHLLGSGFAIELPQDCILFNTEQLLSGESPAAEVILQLAARYRVWDYSSANISLLRQVRSGARLQRLRLGFHRELQRVDRQCDRSDAFLFYGSVTPLRQKIFDRIRLSERLRIDAYFGVYGWQRDGLLGRAKAVLNIHSSEARILEWVRILPLLANAIPCIALTTSGTRWDDDQLSYLLTLPEEDPTAGLEHLYGSVAELDRHALEMCERFSDMEDQLGFTREALDASLSSGFVPHPGPVEDPGWVECQAQHDPDPLWYLHAHCWLSDPRTPAEFHHAEGRFRQYHPDPEFYRNFRTPLRIADSASGHLRGGQRIAVVLHFHHEAKARLFFAEFGRWLADIADFYITCTGPVVAAALLSLARDYRIENLLVLQIENRGRDIPSKYICFNQQVMDYDVCLFAHGKSSDHAWFHDHCSMLCGSRQRIEGILDLFARDPALGLLFPDYIRSLRSHIGWGQMRRMVDDLLRPHGWDTRPVQLLEFPAGGFFWARPAALASIHQLQLDLAQLPEEPLDRDNTLLHAIERLPCLSCERAGLRWDKIARGSEELQLPPQLADPVPVELPLPMDCHPFSVALAAEACLEPDLDPVAEALMQQRVPFELLHFHHYDPGGFLPALWRDLLAAMQSEDHVRILITTCSGFDDSALRFLESHPFIVVRRPNQGRCLGALRDTALMVHGLMKEGLPLQRLIFLNDSILPVASAQDCLANLRQLTALSDCPRTCLAGFTDSFERGYHLQSYGLVVNRALIEDVAWLLFWGTVNTDLDKVDLVAACEVGLSTAMASVGVELRPLYPLLPQVLLSEDCPGELCVDPAVSLETLNPSLHLAATLRRQGWCFVKKMRLLDQPSSLPFLREILSAMTPALRSKIRDDLRGLLQGRVPS